MFWIKIQWKLEIFDLNLSEILHRYLDWFGNLLLHFSHLATVVLPHPVRLHPSRNKSSPNHISGICQGEKKSGTIIRTKKLETSVSIIINCKVSTTDELTVYEHPVYSEAERSAHHSCNTAAAAASATIWATHGATAVTPSTGVVEPVPLLFRTETAEEKKKSSH